MANNKSLYGWNPPAYTQRDYGPPVTRTTGTLDMVDELDRFRRTFGAEYFSGKRYRKIAPIHSWISPHLEDISMQEEPGFLIALSESNMRELVKCGLDGIDHRRVREMNPSAAAAWEEYMTIYHLTRSYER
jgi:hypothetical protein